jgi:hypothetical protein
MYKNSRNRVLVRFNRGRLTCCRPLADEIRETRSTKATRKRSKGIHTANDGLPGSCRNDDPVPSLRSLLPSTGELAGRGRSGQWGRRGGTDNGGAADNRGGAAVWTTGTASCPGTAQITGAARRHGWRGRHRKQGQRGGVDDEHCRFREVCGRRWRCRRRGWCGGADELVPRTADRSGVGFFFLRGRKARCVGGEATGAEEFYVPSLFSTSFFLVVEILPWDRA